MVGRSPVLGKRAKILTTCSNHNTYLSLGEKRQNFHQWGSSGPIWKSYVELLKTTNSQFLEKGKYGKNGQNLAIFGQNGSIFCTPAGSSQTGHFHLRTQKIRSQTKLLAAILYFCQKCVFWLRAQSYENDSANQDAKPERHHAVLNPHNPPNITYSEAE